MFAGFFIHVVVYAAVNGVLLVIWALTGEGSLGDLQGFAEDPDSIDPASFWPVWPIVTWGAGLAIHSALVLVYGVLGAGRRRRRRRHRVEMIEHARTAADLGRSAVDSVMTGLRRATGVPGAAEAGPGSGSPARQWVTVMFTDIVNSTQLNEALGDEEWTRVLRRHRETVRRAFADRGGREVSTQGDGFLARFDSPAEAVLCAIDIQRDVIENREDSTPGVRIGIHAGEAVEDDGDLVGRVVNLASRVAAEAAPDEILVTEPVADYLGGRIALEDRGIRELKGFTQPRHLLSVVWQPEAEPAS